MLNRFYLASRILAAAAAGVGILALILVSPLLLCEITQGNSIDWQKLSDAGQTYGAASALLSAVALIGVSASLLVQTRQDKVERIRMVRERHIELIQMILSDLKVYAPATGVNVRSQSEANEYQSRIMVTLWANYAGRMT
jgi:hypothetical protein